MASIVTCKLVATAETNYSCIVCHIEVIVISLKPETFHVLKLTTLQLPRFRPFVYPTEILLQYKWLKLCVYLDVNNELSPYILQRFFILFYII